ncbi:MAG TPA: UDP-N-acetylglucosamine 2-epimerase, partial [Aggregatilineales bacterium]|nr:UDP-N-acetylglucosamine 2-epimerase [Aggregatilineales bacterium]
MTVIGARPEIIQTAPFSRAVRTDGHREVLVHTGQHYDANMSDVFFRDLGVPRPDHNLEVGSSSHAVMTAQIMVRLEPLLLHERPDWVVVFGDTNSTLAGALVAAKLCMPLAHIEAGLRSGDRTMPEEVNRVLVDHSSDLLLAPTDVAVTNLRREGLTRGVHQVGDVRVDVLRGLIDRARSRLTGLLAREGVPL